MAISNSFFVALSVIASLLFSLSSATHVSHDGRAILINGERKILLSGSIHYPRSTPQMWPDLIAKAKEGGLDAIETYVFWNAHEPRRREYNFRGNLDLIKFIKEIRNAGLYAILRIGPYVCAEWNYGGLPTWLQKIPEMKYRTDNKPFKDEMQNFTTLIVNMVKQEGLLAPQGGPIILTQIENEYGNIYDKYGDAGKRYINWCAQLAKSLNIGVPWLMCQQSDAPQPMINTCNGFYCTGFQPNNKNSPKIYTENWTGWFKNWDLPDPHRPAEDLAYSVARFFQTNGTLQNYYMYHGGTNFGRASGGPFITTTYDYDAPLDEYGNIRQPKWGHLKELHASIKMMEKAILYGDIRNTTLRPGVTVSKFSGTNITSGCMLSNENITTDFTVNYNNQSYYLPAWSVSILPDCKKEVYNTAKVDTQTSVMIKKHNQSRHQAKLSWAWRPEHYANQVNGKKSSFTATKLLEQITTTVDASDYLWYTTSVDHLTEGNMTLRVNTTGHLLYAFVNGDLIGSQHSPDLANSPFNFVFKRPITVKKGKNIIALLSVTVGLKNYGAFYETIPAGIVGGPVQLIGGNKTIDLSNRPWSYKIGLDGEEKQLNAPCVRWHKRFLPTKRPFIWYKTTFRAPSGSDPIVVDLQGMGKGVAWVNGNNIGRFWPSYMASKKNCTPCDYRGEFNADRTCNTGCGEPSQRWYHVPREYIHGCKKNTLTLFEEAGGDPSQVSFQTIAVGTICGTVFERKTLNLTCQGAGKISKIEFASFGNPQGTCQAFKKGSCEAPDAMDKITKKCVGHASCSIVANEGLLGACSPCGNVIKKLAVQAVCS